MKPRPSGAAMFVRLLCSALLAHTVFGFVLILVGGEDLRVAARSHEALPYGTAVSGVAYAFLSRKLGAGRLRCGAALALGVSYYATVLEWSGYDQLLAAILVGVGSAAAAYFAWPYLRRRLIRLADRVIR